MSFERASVVLSDNNLFRSTCPAGIGKRRTNDSNGSIPADHDVGLGGQVKVDYLFTNVRNTQLFERQCRVNRMDRHQHAGS